MIPTRTSNTNEDRRLGDMSILFNDINAPKDISPSDFTLKYTVLGFEITSSLSSNVDTILYEFVDSSDERKPKYVEIRYSVTSSIKKNDIKNYSSFFKLLSWMISNGSSANLLGKSHSHWYAHFGQEYYDPITITKNNYE